MRKYTTSEGTTLKLDLPTLTGTPEEVAAANAERDKWVIQHILMSTNPAQRKWVTDEIMKVTTAAWWLV